MSKCLSHCGQRSSVQIARELLRLRQHVWETLVDRLSPGVCVKEDAQSGHPLMTPLGRTVHTAEAVFKFLL